MTAATAMIKNLKCFFILVEFSMIRQIWLCDFQK